MLRRWKILFSIIMVLALVMYGCSAKQNDQTNTDSNTAAETTDTAKTDTVNSTADDSSSDSSDSTTIGSSKVVVDKEFTANDLEIGYDSSTATRITLNENNIAINGSGAEADQSILTISSEGTYVIKGTLNDGQIIVDAPDTEKVHLILNGVNVSCSNNAAIYIKSADKVFITLEADTENILSDGSSYTLTDENNVDGVIFSKADLTLNGDGSLEITGNYKHGIVSKDDLVITGGTYQINAVKNTLSGKNCVKIKDGTLNLTSSMGKGIKSKNSDDATKGYVYIAGGTINIEGCTEGIEGTVILIEAGEISITAQDDGMNAASGSTGANSGLPDAGNTAATGKTADNGSQTDAVNPDDGGFPSDDGGFDGNNGGFGRNGGGAFENDTDCVIQINGGNITVNASGDGIDSNGSLYVSGGIIYVSGPTSDRDGGLDYNGTGQVTGGVIVVAGSAGMAQCFDDTSTQNSLLYNFTASIAAGTEIKLSDSDGNTVISFSPEKEYQSVVISTPKLAKDASYTLACGETAEDITLSSVVSSFGAQNFQGPGGFAGNGRAGRKP